MTSLTLLALAFFFTKLLWNVVMPVHLEVRYFLARKRNQAMKSTSVSMLIMVELFFLVVAVVSSVFDSRADLIGNPVAIMICGIFSIACSYVLAICAGRLVRTVCV